MKSSSDKMPLILEAVGDGSYRYAYNINKIETVEKDAEENDITTIRYDYDVVVVWGMPDANKITEAVIVEEYPANYEQKLINEYNMAKLGMCGKESSEEAKAKIAAYTEYLNHRAELKAAVDNYFNNK